MQKVLMPGSQIVPFAAGEGHASHGSLIDKGEQISKQNGKSASIRKNSRDELNVKTYETYLRKRYEETGCALPTVDALFKELQCRGYLGNITNVRKFVAAMRRETENSQKFLSFHKDYLIKRVKESPLDKLPASQLFKEIQDRGYRGSKGHVQKFLAKIQRGKSYVRCPLRPYEDYLIERLKGVELDAVSGVQLFRELQERGYCGSIRVVRVFLKTMRSRFVPPETFLSFHEHYLIERTKNTQPNCVSIRTLFNEIKKRGYRGGLSTLQRFVTTIRKGMSFEKIATKGYEGSINTVQEFLKTMRSKGGSSAAHFLYFHRDYLIKRIEESHSCDLSALSLFEEIKAKGYRGTLRNVQAFVSATRREERRPEAQLDFHKKYLTKRSQEISAIRCFEEIKQKGYRGTLKRVRAFVSANRQHKRCSAVFSSTCKEYLIKRLQEDPSVSGNRLFEELKAQGYPGSLRQVQAFVSANRKEEHNFRVFFRSHKEYMIKRLQEDPSVSGSRLFEELKAQGYRGSLKTMQPFLYKIRRDACPKDLGKRVKEDTEDRPHSGGYCYGNTPI